MKKQSHALFSEHSVCDIHTAECIQKVWSYTSEQYCGPKHLNNNTTLSQNIRTAPTQKYMNKCIEKSAFKSTDLNHWLTNKSQQGEDMRKEINTT